MKSPAISSHAKSLTDSIMTWYSSNYRDLPWRSTKDPYIIWLSEIILQQTRISQGLPYFEKFRDQYPSIHDLASAEESEVLKLWQGLGYYSRARNLHHTSKIISKEMNGTFPNTYKELLKLKGVGKYTAAAIASICFDEKVPAIDGNAFRVLSRLFAINKDIASSSSFSLFFETGQSIMPEENTGFFNQAIMDLGSMICLPTKPKCDICPVQVFCLAKKKNLINSLPVKINKLKIKSRSLNYFIIKCDDSILIKQRLNKDIWQGLFEFLLVEESSIGNILDESKVIYRSDTIEHRLTHQKLSLTFSMVEVKRKWFDSIEKDYNMKSIVVSEIGNFAVPKPIEQFLKTADLLLNSDLN